MWWRNSYQPFRIVECPNQLSQILKHVGLADSTTQASLLLKNNAVEMRPWNLNEWWSKVNLKTKLPEGEPIYLRVGKRVYGLQTVMFPLSDQTMEFWEELVNES